jgi:hypothetical protein
MIGLIDAVIFYKLPMSLSINKVIVYAVIKVAYVVVCYALKFKK